MSATTFADLGVSRATANALHAEGFDSPFAVQSLVLPDALAGKDLLVRSPTGSGKTLAFGVPMIERLKAEGRRPSGLVLAPTRELVSQICDALRPIAHARALSVAPVYGGVGIVAQERKAVKAHIVVATPGRLEDLLGRGHLSLRHVEILVLDEADRMLDMGFKPAVDRIVDRTPPKRQTLLFSATLDARVRDIAARDLRNPVTHEHGDARPGVTSTDVEHRFVRVLHERKVDHLVDELNKREVGRTIVFVRTKRGADRLVKRLDGREMDAVAMHGDKSQGQRERALAAFESGKVITLVATDVAARGIDVDDVTHVINFDAPEDREAYVHRVGRTARAGNSGVGITFVLDDQARDVAGIAAELELHDAWTDAGFGIEARGPRGQRPAPSARRSSPPSARPAREAREDRPAREERPRREDRPKKPRREKGAVAPNRTAAGQADRRERDDRHERSDRRDRDDRREHRTETRGPKSGRPSARPAAKRAGAGASASAHTPSSKKPHRKGSARPAR